LTPVLPVPRHLSGEDDRESMDSGPMVRAYSLAGGRLAPKHPLDLLAQITSCGGGGGRMRLDPEHVQILRCCEKPMSVVEIAALIKIPVRVTKVLIGDLIDFELVAVGGAAPPDGRPSFALMQQVLDGIRAL
jgi:hypothetical protein